MRPEGTLPLLTRRGQVFDVLIAVSLLLAAISAGDQDMRVERVPHPGPELFVPIEEHSEASVFLGLLLVVAPLVLRRRRPLTVLWIVLATMPWLVDDDAALRVSFYACVIAGYTAAVYSPYRILALASLPVAMLFYSGAEDGAPTVPPGFVPVLILGAIAVAADGLRRWRHRAAVLERDQARALRQAAEHERARIARELHDVVTHNVSVMVIQAGAARKVLDGSPEQAREALLAIESGGRAAMTELRHVMGLLTMDDAGPDADLAPQPGLDRLDALIERVCGSGVPVTLTTSGDPRPMPAGVELAAYRVVQEALTNTVKHAAGASATVLVEFGSDQLRLRITDTGGTSRPAAGGGGHGLIGLRERLAVYGGTLTTGPRLTGGYRVDAAIPLETR
ncbi:two-component sensor histidine kinase [Actinoplanes ianthinogenes]|uniref:histidine kinase n=1 Tax=Actinoplanes ianthinogenes TaxID=122358 RepID=A0ABM7M6D6_9ACTN|nr:two-component sensor histidine kinase [Actinoplanes ianthinogenes]GGR42622.1 two-component sensor histidine kinase [Actinoplanes ianthinogenes]